jgi:CubicO group peptidase (beta-lactamase class C family)
MHVSGKVAAALLLLVTPFSASHAQKKKASPAKSPAPKSASKSESLGASNGFAADRLARIDTFMQRYVDEQQIAGAVGLVLRDGKVVYQRAVGWADKEVGRQMSGDAIFRIASQSKAITSAAIMQLVEQGKIALSDPVSRFIPAYARTTVAIRTDTGRAIVPAKRRITIRDLLTHTSGYSYGTDGLVAPLYEAKGLGPAAGYGWYTADKTEPICTSMERLATLPAVAQPGEAWVYGYSIDILGCVVERVSGEPLEVYLERHITRPLGMKDTYFFLPKSKRDRLTAVYMSDSTGHVRRAPDGAKGQGHYVDGPRMNYAGGAGLVSTAFDYAKFLECIRNGGATGTTRILSPASVALMTTNMVGTLHASDGSLGFGLGFETVDKLGASGYASVGAYGWGGAYASVYKVDPKERLVIVFMLQLRPSGTDIRAKFPDMVYAALVGDGR